MLSQQAQEWGRSVPDSLPPPFEGKLKSLCTRLIHFGGDYTFSSSCIQEVIKTYWMIAWFHLTCMGGGREGVYTSFNFDISVGIVPPSVAPLQSIHQQEMDVQMSPETAGMSTSSAPYLWGLTRTEPSPVQKDLQQAWEGTGDCRMFESRQSLAWSACFTRPFLLRNIWPLI